MKAKITICALPLLVVLTGIWWLGRFEPPSGGPRLNPVDSVANSAPAAAQASTRPAAEEPPATGRGRQQNGKTSRALTFGDTAPVTLADIPPGRFRDELTAIPPAARARALESLARLRVPLNDLASLHVDKDGGLFYACFHGPDGGCVHPEHALDDGVREPRRSLSAEPSGLFSVAVPLSAPPIRHSKPGSAKVIYLDFNGHTVTGTAWNALSGAPAAYVCTPYDTDGNSGSFSPGEQGAIVRIWERVAEDFRAFDVNVTTEEPALFDNQTARVLITKDRDANGVLNPRAETASGVAYLNVFGRSGYASTYSISFVYQGTSAEGRIAGIASHEVGHNMGLSHDGTSAVEYYAGHGGGETSWAPIMGAGNRSLQQWSKGEYFDANNFQDDLAIIAGKLGTRPDDHANTNASSAPLVANGAAGRGGGIIEGDSDRDLFSFTTGAGPVSLTVAANSQPADSNKGALDVIAELLDASGTVLEQSSPPDSTSATVNRTLAAGTYHLRVSPTGAGTPFANPPSGYTVYGSIGEYRVTGTITPPAALVAPRIAQSPDNQTQMPGNAAQFEVMAGGNPAATHQWQRSGDSGGSWRNLSDDATYGGAAGPVLTVSGVALSMNGDRFRCVVSNSAGAATSAAAILTVRTPPPPTLPSFNANAITGTFGRGIPAGTNQNLTVNLAGGSDPVTLQWRLNGVDIPGAVGSAYFLRNWQPADAGVYTVVARNAAGSTTSDGYTQYVTPEGGWQWRNPLPVGNGLTRAAFVNGRFLVGGLRGTLLVSADGHNWTARTVPAANNLFSFHYFNGLYVAMGSLGAIFTSPDTVAWTPRNSGTVHRDGGSGLQDMALGEDRLVAVGLDGLVTTSTDAINWTPGTIGALEDVTGVTYHSGRFQAVSQTTGRIFSSSDGLFWTAVTSPFSSLRRITSGAGKLVAVGNSGEVALSTFGTVWTMASAGTAESLLGVNYVNSQFITVGTNGVIRTSPDGVTWTARSSGGIASTLQNTAFGNGVYVIPGQSGASVRALLTSTDGVFWSDRISGAGAAGTTLRGIAANAAGAVAVGNAGAVLQSSDGRQWGARTSATGNQLNDIHHASNLFVAVGSSGTVIRSANGIDWSAEGISSNTLNGVRHGNGLWVIVAANSQVFTSSSGTGWAQRYSGGSGSLNKVAFGNGVYVAVGNAGQIVSSNNGASWMPRGSGTASNLNDVAFGAGTFTAVGAGVVLTSADGATWTNRSFAPDAMNSVIYAGDHFIATGPGSTHYTSPDGVNWSGRFTGTPSTLNDMAFFNGEVLAVGDNSNILAAGAPLLGTLPAVEADAGSSVTLSLPVSGSAFAVAYQWQVSADGGATWGDVADGAVHSGVNTVALMITGVTPSMNGHRYRLLASNAVQANVPSNAALLTVSQGPPNRIIGLSGDLAFGNVTPGTSSQRTLTVANTGNSPLTVSGVAYPPGFSGNWSSGTIAAGASRNVTVTFAPSAALSFSGNVTVASDATGGANIRAISGTGRPKVAGAAREVGADIRHPNGNTYDQVLLTGTSATITADPGQVTRISFVDLTDDIVQVEFSGPGSLTVTLTNASGPAPAANYNQPAVHYMKGHAAVSIEGTSESTYVSIFSVGRMTAVNQALFRSDVSYDGMADVASLSMSPEDRRFGGVRTANAAYNNIQGITGILAPGVQFSGPVFVGDIAAFDNAQPMLLLGAAGDVRITGGDLSQPNGRAVHVDGFNRLQMTAGTDSHGRPQPAQPLRARLERNGVDVTSQLFPGGG